MSTPNPEERQRMLDDAFKGSALLNNLKLSPEERLLAKLENVTTEAKNAVRIGLVKYPLRIDRPKLSAEVQHAYFQRLETFEKHELANLLSAFLTSHLLSSY